MFSTRFMWKHFRIEEKTKFSIKKITNFIRSLQKNLNCAIQYEGVGILVMSNDTYNTVHPLKNC